MKVMSEETFGPVIPIERVGSLDEAVRLANDSKYGLGSTVFAGKAARALAGKLRAGMTSINSVMGFAGIPSLPFGGIGDSGFGRIHGDEGIREFTRTKSTAEQVMAIPLNMMSFRQPKEMPSRLRAMIKQLYGDGVVAKAADCCGRSEVERPAWALTWSPVGSHPGSRAKFRALHAGFPTRLLWRTPIRQRQRPVQRRSAAGRVYARARKRTCMWLSWFGSWRTMPRAPRPWGYWRSARGGA
jgi:hypothetical protein